MLPMPPRPVECCQTLSVGGSFISGRGDVTGESWDAKTYDLITFSSAMSGRRGDWDLRASRDGDRMFPAPPRPVEKT